MEEIELKKSLVLEQYKEIKTSRRHYSNLRFALFPVYFVVQFGLIQIALNKSADQLLFSEFIFPICGILATYVFWTIEARIGDYYKELEMIGKRLEEDLEFDHKMMEKYEKKGFFNNTKLSIRIVYSIFFAYWCIVLIKAIF